MKWPRLLALLLLAPFLQAHVGSPDVYLDAQAGPYQLFITIRPPTVIPGVAQLEVRAESSGVREIRAVPVPLTTAGAQFAPVPDKLKVSAQDAQFFTGSLWMMASGSWQVRIRVDGDQGTGSVAVPVPSIALTTRGMSSGLGMLLALLMVLLMAGLVLIVGASVREAKLPADVEPSAQNRRHARFAMLASLLLVCAVVAFGHNWWNTAEASYRTKVYRPLQMSASLSNAGTLTLRMKNPEWMNQPSRQGSQNGAPLFTRVMDDLVPDHDHLMHLYALRQPGLDAVYHLHPQQTRTGLFTLQLPVMEPGSYRLYADVVHANGFPETMVASVDVPPGLPGRQLSGDDAAGRASPWTLKAETSRFALPDGCIMEWIRPSGPLDSKVGIPFRFRLLDARGRPATGMQFYMGMLGHAAFVKTDGTTFAHVHPNGSVAMASYMMAQSQLSPSQPQTGSASRNRAGDMAGMSMPNESASLPNEVVFPYGFPTPGHYRIFVQMKHAGTVETAAFDTLVR